MSYRQKYLMKGMGIMRKKLRSLAAFVLVLAMLFVSACTVREEVDENESPADKSEVEAGVDEASEPEDDEEEEEEELTEIEFWMNAWGQNEENQNRIAAAVNEITEKEIGVHVNFTWLPSLAEYDSAVKLAITSETQIDVINTIFFNDYYTQGMLTDLTPYVDEYLADAKTAMGDLFNCASSDGHVYGICEYRDFVDFPCLIINQDMADAAGWTEDMVREIDSWSKLEEMVADVYDYLQENNPGVNIIEGAMANLMWVMDYYSMGEDKFTDAYVYDKLGASGVLVACDQDGNVSNVWDNPQTIACLERAKKWYDNGWVAEDSHISGFTMGIYSGSVFMSLSKSEIGVEMQTESMGSANYTVLYGSQIPLQTSLVNLVTLDVPVTSKETEAACKFINLFYTSKELNDLFSWGQEGVDYQIVDGVASAVDPTDMGAYKLGDTIIGNWFLTTPYAPYPADFREEAAARQADADASKFLGFWVDAAEISTTIGNVTNVLNQYQGQLLCGFYTEELYNEFREALDAAGAQEIIDFYQAAVDAYLGK